MRFRVLKLCLLVVVICVTRLETANAAETAASAAIRKLIEEGWQQTGAARVGAERNYQMAAQLAPGDSRALAAYWLVLMQQRKYDDALTHLNEYLEKQPSSWMALHAKTWVEAVSKKDQDAFSSAEKLGEVLARQSTASGSQSAGQDECVQFLGRLFGFLAGPLEKDADQAERQRVEAKIMAGFDERRKTLFTEARDDVIAEFKDLVGDAGEAAEAAKKSAEENREQALAKIGENRDELAGKTKEIEDKRKETEAKLQKELQALIDQDTALVQRGLTVQQHAATLARQVQRHRDEAAAASASAAKAKQSPDLNSAYQRARENERRVQFQLDTANAEWNRIQFERTAVSNKIAQARMAAGVKGQQLNNQQGALAKDKRKLDLQEKRSKSKAPSIAKARSLDTQARAFSNYDRFPLDKYKKVLLDSL